MLEAIKYGDVFRYNEEDYIFLVQTEEIVYAAKVLDKGKTQKIKELYEKKQRDMRNNGLESRRIFCFVMLDTESFRERMAHLAQPEHDSDNITPNKLGFCINSADKAAIRDEILNPGSPVPRDLKKLVAALDLPN
ncbi:MAG: hypothetical protein WC817_01840 [Patescibacteria group bacterium]|jgi:hypothetical protein